MTAVTRNMRKVIPPMHHVKRKLSAWRETRGGWRCNQTFWRICKVYLRPVSSYPWRNIERQISEFVIFSLSPLRSSFILCYSKFRRVHCSMGIQGAPKNAETPFLPDRSQALLSSDLQKGACGLLSPFTDLSSKRSLGRSTAPSHLKTSQTYRFRSDHLLPM